MKKFLIISLSIISSLFLVDTAKAETKEFEYLTRGLEFNGYAPHSYADNHTSLFESTVYSFSYIDEKIETLLSVWEKDYKKKFPYYFVSLSSLYPVGATYNGGDIEIDLVMLSAIPTNLNSFMSILSNPNNDLIYSLRLDISSNGSSFTGPSTGWYFDSYGLFYTYQEFDLPYYLPFFYYDSSFDLSFGLDDTYVVKKGDETLFTLNKEDIVPTYKDKFIDRTDLNYTEVDLNSHPYVVLSLKDYNKTEEFSFNTYVKGQYCLTPVYDYGLREKKDVLSGSKNQRCSPYYDNYTPVRTYVLESDLKNHAVYYLKAQDTTKENKVKIDTNIFNIHYVSEEEKDNPIITINGKKYSITPFDELTDTANKSEDEGYNSGSSCDVGDFNCTRNTLGVKETSWSDIFSSPLEFLKNIWTSITQVFVIITYFIALLPTTLQYFLYISFMLAIILGIIKIIL